jgi:hypothetical protein
MTAISYRDYASDLLNRIEKLRASRDISASVEIAICRNSFCYKSIEATGPRAGRKCAFGPLNSSADLLPEDGSVTSKEIASFFALPEIYAYSERALVPDRSPLAKAHWDGTVALIEVRYETALTQWHQRMLFIGFADPIHADFTIGLDDDLFVHDANPGTQLFEWRADEAKSGDMPKDPIYIARADGSVSVQPAQSFGQRIAGLARGRWLPRSIPRHTPAPVIAATQSLVASRSLPKQ